MSGSAPSDEEVLKAKKEMELHEWAAKSLAAQNSPTPARVGGQEPGLQELARCGGGRDAGQGCAEPPDLRGARRDEGEGHGASLSLRWRTRCGWGPC
uniref:Uncharacterized protein n=1 Tax=Alexandrium monilatum TaxID=311494 RepID=A0A7S4SV72_9DINO